MKQFRLSLLAILFIAVLPTMAQSRQVMLETTAGNILLTLYDDTPKHRDNFLKLVNEEFYDSLLFHRVIKNFMIQGGDPDSKKAEPGVTLGEGSTDYTVEAEFFDSEGHLLHPHQRGVLAMAREGDSENPERRSSGCQFYIVWGKTYATQQLYQIGDKVEAQTDHRVTMTPELLDLYRKVGGVPHLDGQYTVFGEVTEGLDVVDRIQQVQTDDYDRPIDDVRILRAREVQKE
ncbi:MAG: peptidylprolyl isomerase [Prevotella sp.]|nr:peptidylprolyl isomerase [Prevotella sp.]MBO7538632.1 peptidylprolyl isomerase [Prevotella sp.]